MSLNLWALAPEMFRYQGRLVDGTNLVNATLPMSFKLYDAQSGGVLVYEDASSVLVVDGLYSTTIGDNTAFGSLTNALTHAAVYLELTVNGSTLSPRERLVSMPYALHTPPPVLGDPSATSKEVINDRWTKNVYANGDITMSDRDTGLTWLYDASFASQTNWYVSGTYCADLNYAGHSDWRLPYRYELLMQSNFIELFSGVQGGHYWSGTSRADKADSAWVVSMFYSSVLDGGSKAGSYYVWPVRGGQAPSQERIISLGGNMNFGDRFTEATNTATMTIMNYGAAVLTVTGIHYSDAYFSGNWSGTLPAGGSTNITVTFIPPLAQNYTGTITVNSDATSGTNSIACTGTGKIRRYIDHGDGTVTDTATGLMWMQNVNIGSRNYFDAWNYCDTLIFAGYSDWRLPSVARDGGTAELDTLGRTNGNPTGAWEGFGGGFTGAPFYGVQGLGYWSSTWVAPTSSDAWLVHMGTGFISPGGKLAFNRVWPVRGGQ